MELGEVLRRRRMVRSFSGLPVAAETLTAVLAAARRTPAAGNVDGWDLLVLEGAEQTKLFWEATTTPSWRDRSQRWPGLARAPVVICVFVRPLAYLERYDEPDKAGSGLGSREAGGDTSRWSVPFWFFDAGCVVLAMLLSAIDEGVGACFLGNFKGEPELRASLAVPSDRVYVGAVLIGEPGGADPPSRSVDRQRRDLDQVVHRAKWGAESS